MSLSYLLPMGSLPWQVIALLDGIALLHIIAFCVACYLWLNDILKVLMRGKIVDDRPNDVRGQPSEIQKKWEQQEAYHRKMEAMRLKEQEFNMVSRALTPSGKNKDGDREIL